MYNYERPHKSWHCLLLTMRYCNERPKKIEHKARCFKVYIEQRRTNEQWEGKKYETRRREVEKLRLWKPHIVKRFMKLLELKVHYHEIEALCHKSSWFEKIVNYFRRFVKLVEHSSNIGWKVYELAWNLHETFDKELRGFPHVEITRNTKNTMNGKNWPLVIDEPVEFEK